MAVLIREKKRQENLENLGLVVVRWGWDTATLRRRTSGHVWNSASNAGGIGIDQVFLANGRLSDRNRTFARKT